MCQYSFDRVNCAPGTYKTNFRQLFFDGVKIGSVTIDDIYQIVVDIFVCVGNELPFLGIVTFTDPESGKYFRLAYAERKKVDLIRALQHAAAYYSIKHKAVEAVVQLLLDE